MRAKSARTGFLQIAECDSALATDQNNKRRSRGLNPDCWTVAWTSRHYQLQWVLRHFSDKGYFRPLDVPVLFPAFWWDSVQVEFQWPLFLLQALPHCIDSQSRALRD